MHTAYITNTPDIHIKKVKRSHVYFTASRTSRSVSSAHTHMMLAYFLVPSPSQQKPIFEPFPEPVQCNSHPICEMHFNIIHISLVFHLAIFSSKFCELLFVPHRYHNVIAFNHPKGKGKVVPVLN